MGTPHILIVSGHPDLNHSIANATILDEVETALPDAEIRRLTGSIRTVTSTSAQSRKACSGPM